MACKALNAEQQDLGELYAAMFSTCKSSDRSSRRYIHLLRRGSKFKHFKEEPNGTIARTKRLTRSWWDLLSCQRLCLFSRTVIILLVLRTASTTGVRGNDHQQPSCPPVTPLIRRVYEKNAPSVWSAVSHGPPAVRRSSAPHSIS